MAVAEVFDHVVHPLFVHTIVNPNINKVPSDKGVIDNILENIQPKIVRYLNSQIDGKFLVGNALTLADIAIVSNFIVFQYMGGQYPKLAKYLKGIAATDSYRKALEDEKPFVARSQDGALKPASAVLSAGFRSLGSCPRAAGWSAATLCHGPFRPFARCRNMSGVVGKAEVPGAVDRSSNHRYDFRPSSRNSLSQ